MSESLTITLNGEPRALVGSLSVSELIDELQLSKGRIAVEVNREIVPRSEHAKWTLENGDVVEIIHAIGGG